MAHVKFDLVQETSISTGAATLALAGALTRRRRFGDVMANGDTAYVLIENSSAAEYQICLATWNTGHSLTVGAVLASSTGSAVNFSAGTKTISLIAPANKMVVMDNNGDAAVTRNLSVGGFISATGNVSAGGYVNTPVNLGYLLGGSVAFNGDATYNKIYDGVGAAVAFTIGNTGDPTTYYDNTTHVFRTRSGAAVSAQINATGLGVGGGPGAKMHSTAADGTKLLGLSGTTKGIRVVTSGAAAQIDGVSSDLVTSYQPLTLNGSLVYFANSGTLKWQVNSSAIRPEADAAVNFADPSFRVGTYYGVAGAINTSDAHEKDNFTAPDEVDAEIALELAGLFQWWQWKDAIAKKGAGNARWHFGLTAQQVVAAFASRNRSPFTHALVGFDELEKNETFTTKVLRAKVQRVEKIVEAVEIVNDEPTMVEKPTMVEEPVGEARVVKRNGKPVLTVLGQRQAGLTDAGEPIMEDVVGPLTHFVQEMEEVDEVQTRVVPDMENGQRRIRLNVRPDQLQAFILWGIAKAARFI